MYKLKISKDYRITIPKSLTKNLKYNNFYKVIIRKKNETEYFYFRIPKKCPSRKYLQIRRKLPEETIRNLQLKPNDNIELVRIFEIKKYNSNILLDKHINLLSLKLDSIMIDKFSRNGIEWVRFWQSTKNGGRTIKVDLKRFVPIDRKLGEFFGLIQAEARKNGSKFDFTNVLKSEHKIILDIFKNYFGVSRSRWSFGLICNPKFSKDRIEEEKLSFAKELGLNPKKGYDTRSKTIISFAYNIYINRKILNLVMNKILILLREDADKKIGNKNLKEFYRGFLIKCLLGDGHVAINRDLTSMDLILSEKNKKAQQDIMNILNSFNINSRASGIRIDISTNIDACMWFLENGLFIGHNKNRNKFLKFLNNNFYIKTRLKRFSKIGNSCTTKEFAEKNLLSCNTAKMYLNRNVERGFLKNSYKPNTGFVYKLTNKGSKFLSTISHIIPSR